MTTTSDIKSVVAGAVVWAVAIPAVKLVGQATAGDAALLNKGVALILGAGIAAATTPLMSKILSWKNRNERVRGIALALGAAQTLDGLVHIFWPKFYSDDGSVGLACAGNIFYGAGLLGILSAYA